MKIKKIAPDFLKSELHKIFKILKWTPIDTYIVKNFFFSLMGSLLFFVIIYELTQFFNEIRYLPKNVDGYGLFLFHLYDGIYWLVVFQPFSFLFATVYVLSRMAHFKELVAIASTGISIYRTTFYMVILTLIYYFLLIFYIQDNIIFPTYQKRYIIWQRVFHNYKTDESIQRLKDNQNFSIFGNHNIIYIVSYYNSITKELEKITIVKFEKISTNIFQSEQIGEMKSEDIEWLMTNIDRVLVEKGLSYPANIRIGLRIDADRAIWIPEEKKWKFNTGVLRCVANSGESFSVIHFTNQTFDFVDDPPYYFEKMWYPVEAMTYKESKLYVEKLKKSRQDYKGAEANYYSKFTYGLGIIFIVLAGIGIVDMSRRKISFIVNLMLSMLLFVIYYLFYAMGISLAAKGDISTITGATAGSVFLGVFSIYLFMKAKT
ncbi:MAG: LptF/LptG family permease [Brevinematia bacterium]